MPNERKEKNNIEEAYGEWKHKQSNVPLKARLKAVLNSLRIAPISLAGWLPWLAAISVATGTLTWITNPYYLSIYLLMGAFMMNMGVINDFYDRYVDRIASEHYKEAISAKDTAPHVTRILSDEDISKLKDAMLTISGIALGIAVTYFGYVQGRWLIVSMFIVAHVLNIAYSIFRLKGRDLGLPYTFGIPLYSLLPYFIIAGVTKAGIAFYLIAGVIPAWSHACGKDFKDYEADKTLGMKTLPTRNMDFAAKNVMIFTGFAALLALMLGPIGEPYGLMLVDNWWFVPSLIPVAIYSLVTVMAFIEDPLGIPARATGFFFTIFVQFFIVYAFVPAAIANRYVISGIPVASLALTTLSFIVMVAFVKKATCFPKVMPTAPALQP